MTTGSCGVRSKLQNPSDEAGRSMAKKEKIRTTPVVKDNQKFLYYIKDGKVFRVPKKQAGGLRGQSKMEYDAKLKQDPDYIYFVDKDGDIARVPRARGGQPRKRKKTGSRKAIKPPAKN